MTNPKMIAGGCICGAVRYEVHGPLRQIVACHCEQCRRFSGHFVSATATRKQYFQYLKIDGLKWYSYQSGLRQGFCQDCGSSLFFEDEHGERISIAAGSLDEAQGLTIAAHIFAAEAGDIIILIQMRLFLKQVIIPLFYRNNYFGADSTWLKSNSAPLRNLHFIGAIFSAF